MSKQSDEAAYEELVQRFQRPLQRYAARIIGDADLARDVVQDTFIQLVRAQRQQTDAAPAKWLFTVCRNRALNVCRKDRRLALLDEKLLACEPSNDPAPYQPMQAEEATGFLLRILETLPLRQQEVLQLKFQNGLSYEEISHITGLSVSNVGVLIHNALKALRQR